MASITKEKNGRRTIQFVGADGRRRSIRLGKVSQRIAENVKTRVELLNTAVINGQSPDSETARWVAGLDFVMQDKLARVGLCESPQARNRVTLAEFLDAYIKGRSDLKPRTIAKLTTTRDDLVEHFGSEKALTDISPGDADDWRLGLVGRKLSENTVRKHASIAKQFFTSAVRKRLIPANPFSDLRSTIQANPARFYFVSREEAEAVINACPDAEWRLLFALSRYGGLRCPSEHLALRWSDIDWERDRMRVRSPKTEHHADGASRIVPIFPELRPYLDDCFNLPGASPEFVIARYRDTNVNLRTQLLRIIGRAGLNPWPKLFQNLRSSRQTELEESFPSHVVCAWIGNSRAVAAKHYLQVTDEHFSKAVQNPVQLTPAKPRNPPLPKPSAQAKAPVLQGRATRCDYLHKRQVAEEGLEPPTRGL